MQDQLVLPEPGADARDHSARLIVLLREHIAAAGGWIDFAEYMRLALYAPGLGYYSAGARKFGPDGDFVTAPEISTLFSRCLARAIAPVLREAPAATILELGAGTGNMAAEILHRLGVDNLLPDRYLILEVSADLRERQHALLAARAPEYIDRVAWCDELPTSINGIVLANEVADALPVSRFRIRSAERVAGRVQSVGVVAHDDGFRWQVAPGPEHLVKAVDEIEFAIGTALPAGFTAEVCLTLPGFVASLCGALDNGVCVMIDYGLARSELYRTSGTDGTLLCHYRHHAHDDPFRYPGLQDITAWVDFTAIAEAAIEAGARVEAFASQARFLIAAGIEREFDRARPVGDESETHSRLRVSREMQTLLMPGQMGEKFKVMCLSRGTHAALAGISDLAPFDQRHRL